MRRVLSALILALVWGLPRVATAAPLGSVQGVVRDATGTPLKRVRVVIVAANRPPGTLLPQATTGSDGSFKLSKLAPGRYTVVFYIDLLGLEQSRGPVQVTGDHVNFVEERLDLSKVTGALSGKVVDAAGHPAAGTRVNAVLRDPAGPTWSRSVRADAHGAFRIGDLPPGKYSVSTYYGSGTASATAFVQVGHQSRVVLRLAKKSDPVRIHDYALLGVPASKSPRSMAHSWLVLPTSGLEVGTTLSFLTAPPAGGGQTLPGMTATQLRFSDVALFGLSARYSINGKVELHGDATLLPKQPVGAGDPVFQGASGGGRLAIGKHFAADLDVGGGPLLGDQGTFGTAQAAFRGKTTVDRSWRTITFEGAAGADATNLFRNQTAVGATGKPPASDAWFTEALAQADILLHTPRGEFGGWVGFDLRFPIAHGAGAAGPALDPQTRANFQIGTVYALARDWDLWAEYDVIDRGDVSDPATTLPILDGGFDQRQLIFGVVRRFDLGRRSGASVAVPYL